MKSIKFSEKEIEFLREQYTEELANAELYVEQIKEILNKLGVQVKAKPAEKENKTEKKEAKALQGKNKEPKKRGRKPKEVKPAEVKAEPKKRGRKPKVVIPAAEPELPALPINTEVARPVKKDRKPKTDNAKAKTTSSKAAVIVKKEIKPAPKKKAKNHSPKGKKKVANTLNSAKKVEPLATSGDALPPADLSISATQE